MDIEGGIDWYSLSKMDVDSFDFQQFNQLLSVAHPEQGIGRVTTHYRKKLLLMFQNASKNMKQQLPHLLATQNELTVKKIVVAEQLQAIESEVEGSFKEISNLKLILNEKKRLKNRLKEKLQKRGLIKQKKIYYCSVCGREDFLSSDQLKSHFDRQHGQLNVSRGGVGQVGELKDLLMTMKDKEIEMMSMFLRASRQFQTQKLENEYAQEYKKFANESGNTDQSLQQPQQLKSESQFLFFKKSEQFRRQMERDQEFRYKMNQQRTQRQTLNTQFYQKGNYYNVFGTIPQNNSLNVENVNNEGRGATLRTEKSAQKTQQNISENYGYYDHNQIISKFLKKNDAISRDSRFSLVEHTPKPYVQTHDMRGNYREGIYSSQMISDRLNQPQHKSVTEIPTMFGTKRKFYEESGYVFNSGPLQEDQGGDSDYQDYFGKNAKLNISIQDQEIKVNFRAKAEQIGSKQSFHLSKMLSPKEHSSSSILDKSLKDKSSVIVDLSDSFSKRDFEISKDDQTINLSDLKLSKLEKKKQQEKLNKLKEINRKEQNQSNIPNSFRLNKQTALIMTPQSEKQLVKTKEIHILKQFQKAPVMPLREEQYRFSKNGSGIAMFVKSNDRVNVVNATVQSDRSNENNLGILNQFLREQFKGQNNPKSKGRNRGELQQFINK